MRQNTIFVDCTLRDGSYLNKFSFTPKNTFEVYKNLSEAKIKLIEVGHGLGIGAYRIKKFYSNYSDESHFKALNKINNTNSSHKLPKFNDMFQENQFIVLLMNLNII